MARGVKTKKEEAMGANTPIISKDYTHGIHVLVYYEIFI